jgi:hypothetical protein
VRLLGPFVYRRRRAYHNGAEQGVPLPQDQAAAADLRDFDIWRQHSPSLPHARSCSDDGGHTFGNYLQPPSLGNPPAGAYEFRVVWMPLGMSRDRIFRVTITDPVKIAIVNAYIDCVAGYV